MFLKFILSCLLDLRMQLDQRKRGDLRNKIDKVRGAVVVTSPQEEEFLRGGVGEKFRGDEDPHESQSDLSFLNANFPPHPHRHHHHEQHHSPSSPLPPPLFPLRITIPSSSNGSINQASASSMGNQLSHSPPLLSASLQSRLSARPVDRFIESSLELSPPRLEERNGKVGGRSRRGASCVAARTVQQPIIADPFAGTAHGLSATTLTSTTGVGSSFGLSFAVPRASGANPRARNGDHGQSTVDISVSLGFCL